MKTRRSTLQGASAASLALLLLSLPARGATITVDSLIDEVPTTINGSCSLREALMAADDDMPMDSCTAGESGTVDEIRFSVTGTISLEADLPQVSGSLSIVGPGADLLTLSGESEPAPGAPEPTYQLLYVVGASQPQTFGLKGLTLRAGLAPFGGCLYLQDLASSVLDHVRITGCRSATHGGGLLVSRNVSNFTNSLQILWSEISFNDAMGSWGGGIFIAEAVDFTLEHSAVVANRIRGPFGGGIAVANSPPSTSGTSTVDIRHSTVADNTADFADGGGLYLAAGVTAMVTAKISHSTFTGNVANASSTFVDAARGAGIFAEGDGLQLDLLNTIVANNLDLGGNPTPTIADDLEISAFSTPTVTTGGHNYLGAVTDPGMVTPFLTPGLPNGNNDFVGTAPAGLDPALSFLGNHGGPTLTRIPVSAASPVVDQGAKCTEEPFDQRGFGDPAHGRIVDLAGVPNHADGNGCDIGAVELDGIPVSDYDGDGMTDGFEDLHPGLDPLNPADAGLDPDTDNLTNLQEFEKDPGLDPNDPDSDDDWIQDDLDDLPIAASNACSGADAVFGALVNGPVQCAAALSVLVESGTEVTGTGRLEIFSPLIVFAGDCGVTGQLEASPVDPCPACP